ncbi:hypothetical protein Taro_052660 [Colocasia esculenta]|uniref:Uncharacterized protein n=1 Tax=Colocasia esculenta TaxID=4460 RepID=A0A843XJ65_COLES|nr:hypothetical protein [Colocasia esculenta]
MLVLGEGKMTALSIPQEDIWRTQVSTFLQAPAYTFLISMQNEMNPLHTMDQQAEEEATGILISTTPPPSTRSGVQPRKQLNEGYGGVSRDPADGEHEDGSKVQADGGVGDQVDGGVVCFDQAEHEDGSKVQADSGVLDQADGAVSFDQAEHEGGSKVQADGGSARDDQADAGVRFQADHEDGSKVEADGGVLVYDNVVVGDPSGVVIGRGNYGGRRVAGRVSGNRVIR